MAVYAISDRTLTALADAIRAKAGINDQLSTDRMIQEINALITHTQDIDGFIMRTATALASNSATSVADYSMFSNQALEEVSLPAVREIGEYAFCSCGNLREVVTGAAKIGSYAFFGCDRLQLFAWSNQLNEISVGAFDGCTSLHVVNLKDSPIAAIGASAFSNSGINELWLPKSRFCSIPNASTFSGTPIGTDGTGGTIYVPQQYRVQYESNNRWASVFRNDKNRVISY